MLAGGERLPAGELLDHARSAALDIEQVFLAACRTSVTGSDHDEVLNLAAAFLARGTTVEPLAWAGFTHRGR